MPKFVDIDIRKVSDMSSPVFMLAEINYDKALKCLNLITKEGHSWIFGSVTLYDINSGFTYLRGINCEDNGAVCSEWQIRIAYDIF